MQQVCCEGALHNQQPDYECCGTNYLPVRSSSLDVCCGGQFHPFQLDYQCCSGQYVSVPAGQICCIDPDEDRVAVGAGDACCRGIPFDTAGPQICCAGTCRICLSSQLWFSHMMRHRLLFNLLSLIDEQWNIVLLILILHFGLGPIGKLFLPERLACH